MAKYNTKTVPARPDAVTHEGGAAYKRNPKTELVALLATGITNTFYEKEDDRAKRLMSAIKEVATKDKLFAAKALIYARDTMGQRSATHLGAAMLAPYLSGDPVGTRFYGKRKRGVSGGIVYRIDDMFEILAAYQFLNPNKPIPNAIKRGFKAAIEDADMFELARYKGEGRKVSLVDIVNLVHPTPSKKNGSVEVSVADYNKAIVGTKFVGEKANSESGTTRIATLRALVLGLLKQVNTVESTNSEAGQVIAKAVKAGTVTQKEADDLLVEAKTENFRELIESKKIGYLALLRNMRNILNLNDNTLTLDACRLLVNEDFIKRSRVFPHQIDLALEVLMTEFSNSSANAVFMALNTAYDLSVPNLAGYFEGRTAVVVDSSASMTSSMVTTSNGKGRVNLKRTVWDKATLVAATLAKGIGADVFHFASGCEAIKINVNDSVRSIASNIASKNGRVGHGTDLPSVFSTLGSYDRIFIVSDLQTVGYAEQALKSYENRHGQTYLYCVDMCGYNATPFKESSARVFSLFGYTSSMYELAKQVEVNPAALIDEINKIVI